jgi:hypothetical protein
MGKNGLRKEEKLATIQDNKTATLVPPRRCVPLGVTIIYGPGVGSVPQRLKARPGFELGSPD